MGSLTNQDGYIIRGLNSNVSAEYPNPTMQAQIITQTELRLILSQIRIAVTNYECIKHNKV